MFYTYSQNNSGGSFVLDIDRGLTAFVIIEAYNAREADSIANDIGIYFDGCESGYDCSCCGDRWYSAWQDDTDTEPLIYGKSPEDYVNSESFLWMEVGRNVCVHYLDGRKEWF